MIEFPCRCKYLFKMPDAQAGLSVQCPQCGLLVDVPNVGDKGRIEPDGTYSLNTLAEPLPDHALEDLTLVYYPKRQLPDGTEIDLRGPVEPVSLASFPAPADEPLPKDRPKYDPETGELMPPLDLQQISPPTPAQALPQATRVIDYGRSRDVLESTPHGSVFVELFLPSNLFVMLIILGAHMVMAAMMTALFYLASLAAMVSGTWHLSFLVAFPILFLMLIAGHYATTLEEVGRGEMDDLPRILRNVQLYEDYLVPAGRTALALLLCYWPAIMILYMNYSAAVAGDALPFPMAGRWLLGTFVLGSIFLPAVFLTICTSGTLLNMRPDRVVGLMLQMGLRYMLFVLQWLLASTIYMLGTLMMVASFVGIVDAWYAKPYASFSMLVAGIYLTFAFCWHLGLHYRQHWQSYPWVMQYHEHRTTTIVRPKAHPQMPAALGNNAKRAKSSQQIR